MSSRIELLARRDVARDREDGVVTVEDDVVRGDLGDHRRAVFAYEALFEERRGRAVREHLPHALHDFLAIVRVHELDGAKALDVLVARVAEHRAERGVHVDDRAVPVDDDAVGHVLDERAKARLGARERAARGVALCGVAHHRVHRLASVDRDLSARELDGEDGAVLRAVPSDVGAAPRLGGRVRDRRARPVRLGADVRHLQAAGRLLAGVTVERDPRLVHFEDALRRGIEDRHGIERHRGEQALPVVDQPPNVGDDVFASGALERLLDDGQDFFGSIDPSNANRFSSADHPSVYGRPMPLVLCARPRPRRRRRPLPLPQSRSVPRERAATRTANARRASVAARPDSPASAAARCNRASSTRRV